jgi:hypothetical protein
MEQCVSSNCGTALIDSILSSKHMLVLGLSVSRIEAICFTTPSCHSLNGSVEAGSFSKRMPSVVIDRLSCTACYLIRAATAYYCSGISVLGAILTYFTYTTWGPWVTANVPTFDRYMSLAPFIQGPLIAAAGVAHFTNHEDFTNFYPHKVCAPVSQRTNVVAGVGSIVEDVLTAAACAGCMGILALAGKSQLSRKLDGRG